MRLAHLAMTAALLALACAASAPGPESGPCVHSGTWVEGFDCADAGEALSNARNVSAALGLEPNLRGWTVLRSTLTATPEEMAQGYRHIYARSNWHARVIELVSLDHLCHEVVHVGRNVWDRREHVIEGGQCVAGWFCEQRVDSRCAEAR